MRKKKRKGLMVWAKGYPRGPKPGTRGRGARDGSKRAAAFFTISWQTANTCTIKAVPRVNREGAIFKPVLYKQQTQDLYINLQNPPHCLIITSKTDYNGKFLYRMFYIPINCITLSNGRSPLVSSNRFRKRGSHAIICKQTAFLSLPHLNAHLDRALSQYFPSKRRIHQTT